MTTELLKPGDVFSIPLGDGRFGLGQAVTASPQDSVYMVIFDAVLTDVAEISNLTEFVETAEFRLFAWAGSVLVEIGRWEVLGNVPVRQDFPKPAFKVAIGGPGSYYVEDWDMTRRRPARAEEAARLPLRTSFSAAAVELALKADLGLEPWIENFDVMRPGGPTTQEMFGDD